MAGWTRIPFEQKGTKETKEGLFFVAFVSFCANSISRAAQMENSESVKSGKSVVQFLSLRLAALGSLRSFPARTSFDCHITLVLISCLSRPGESV
jgi:hypothetical protein